MYPMQYFMYTYIKLHGMYNSYTKNFLFIGNLHLSECFILFAKSGHLNHRQINKHNF